MATQARKSSGKSASSKKSSAAKGKTKTKGKTASAGGGRGKANAAFMKPMNISETLAEIVGDKPLPRTEVTKKVWAYIKKNRLQDTENKRQINADDKLRKIFGNKDQVSMFEMTKLVSRHLS
jgi:upstream activation factor subunit UAF30